MHASVRTSFDPRIHGFMFENDFQTTLWESLNVGPVHIPRLRLGGLCGGMTFAALDNYYAGRAAETTNELPAIGSPLHERIYRRHLASVGLRAVGLGVPVPHTAIKVLPVHVQNLLRYPFLRAAPAVVRKRENRTALIALRRWLSEGYPVPLGLVSPQAVTDSHQVAAYGFNDGVHATEVHVYDCRFPAKTVRLTIAENGSSCVLKVDGRAPENWLAFFVSHYDQTPKPGARAEGRSDQATEDVS